jgi:hypothetical protein
MKNSTLSFHIWKLSLLNLAFTALPGLVLIIWLYYLNPRLLSEQVISSEKALIALTCISLFYLITMSLIARKIAKSIAGLTNVVEKTTAENFSATHIENFSSPYIELSIIKRTFLNKVHQLNQQLNILKSLSHLQELIQSDVCEAEFLNSCQEIYLKYFELNFKTYDPDSDSLIFKEKTIHINPENQKQHHGPIFHSKESEITEPFDQTVRFFFRKNLLQEEFLHSIEKDNEFQVGKRVQTGLLPVIAETDRSWQLSFFVKSALHFGGDFLDLPTINENPCFLIADVSGKGLPAALFAATIKSWFTAFSSIHFELDKILEKINTSLLEMQQSSFFCTLFAGIYHEKSGTLRYSSAGHNRMLLIRDNELVRLDSESLPLGMVKGETFQTIEVPVAKNNLLFLYTDGVTEAENSSGGMYGYERLSHFLLQNTEKSPEELKSLLTGELIDFTGDCPQSDDITFMFIRFC